MSYTALYRKWRPKGFNDIIGQEHIVKTLKNQILSNRISHAYLFCGTRGTGKTSTAKIFAKAVNCTEAINGEACNECNVCKNILAGRSMSVIEIDAASNNGVDNIREIREEVKYPPTEGKYKVYIIDEVHMLSTGAFNALLKTLEEPPEHVIFILATTDASKIPVTILSRCQRYDFRRISTNDMSSKIAYYMEQEGINLEDKALRYISQLSDGAMRDALSILDQCIAFYYGEDITLQKVLDTVGAVDNEVFYRLVDAIIQNNSIQCIDIVDEIVIQGRDIRQFVTGIIVHLRNLLVVKTSNTENNILDLSQNNVIELSQQAKNISGTVFMNLIKDFSALELQLKYSGNDKILLEVLLIKLCQQTKENTIDYQSLLDRITKLESNVSKGIHTVATSETVVDKPIKKKILKAVPEDIKLAVEIWKEIYKEFRLPFKAILQDTTAGYLQDNFLYIICADIINQNYIEKRLDKLTKVLEEKMVKTFQLKTISKKDFEYEYSKLYVNTDNEVDEDTKFINNILNNINIDGIPIQKTDE